MGKRKRRADRNNTPPSPPPPAFTSHNSQMEPLIKEKSSHSFGSTGAKPTSSTPHTNYVERSHSHHAHHQSAAHHRHHNVNRTSLSRAPRHYYSMTHTQRNAANRSGTSTSHGKITVRGDKLSWKFDNKPPGTMFSPNTIVMIDAVSCGVMNMHCGLCQKTTIDYSVVAVLVCGHVYHADCLERRTRNGDKSDPPCPLCTPPSVVDK